MKLFLFLTLALVGLAAAVPAKLDITNTEDRQDEISLGLAAVVPAEVIITNTEDRQDETAVSSNRISLLRSREFFASPVPNTINIENYTWIGLPTNRITSWNVFRIGADQGASVFRLGGGNGANFLQLSFESARGRGFHFRLDIYGV